MTESEQLAASLAPPASEVSHVLSDMLWGEKTAAVSVLVREPVAVFALSAPFIISASGWGMLRVPNDIVRGLYSSIDLPGAEFPAASSGETYQAHISVMRKEEVAQIGVGKISERGKRFRYQLGPVCEVVPAGWEEMSKCWFVAIRSPELTQLRRTYGLPNLPIHPETGLSIGFHLTFAVRRKHVLGSNEIAKGSP